MNPALNSVWCFSQALTLPFALNPVIHAVLTAGLKAVGIGRHLHKQVSFYSEPTLGL
jgi:hypothetical protein